jgi:hypothetical protein
MQSNIQKGLMSRILSGVFVSLIWVTAQSAVPLWTIVPAPGSNPTQTVPQNSTSTVQYVVQNQSGRTKQLVIQSIPGIVQTTTCQLAPKGQAGSSCILNLAITGSSLPKVGIHGGPNVCRANANGHPNPNQCYRPSAAHILNIGKGTAGQAAITVNPTALDLVVSSGTPGFLTITNNSTSITAQNVQAVLPASWTDVTQDASNCAAIAPNGSTCQLQFTPGATTHGAAQVSIAGSNTTQATAQLSVSAPGEAILSVTGGPISLVAGCPAESVLTVENTSMTAAADIEVNLQELADNVTVTNNCPNPLLAHDTCTIDLQGVNPASASDISIQGSNTPEVKVSVSVDAALNIGDNYLDGIVFEVDHCNTGKVVTGPLDGANEVSSQWSSQETKNISTDFSNGAQNTTNIINTDPGCTSPANCAAFRCRNFNGSTPDWYLPARYELTAVHRALCSNVGIPCNFGGFSSRNHWSSSQVDDRFSFFVVFPSGLEGNVIKADDRPVVRCVRAFTP